MKQGDFKIRLGKCVLVTDIVVITWWQWLLYANTKLITSEIYAEKTTWKPCSDNLKFWGLLSICLDTGKPKLERMCTPFDSWFDFKKVRVVGQHFVL